MFNLSPIIAVVLKSAGFILTANKVLMITVIVLGILLCGTLLCAIYNIKRSEIYNREDEHYNITPNDLTNITKLADDMSKFIGKTLLGFLIYYVVHTPSDILFIFSERPFALL